MELPRGMRDLESTELYKIHTIREKFEETASIFGFKMVDPSPIEVDKISRLWRQKADQR